MNRNDRPHPGPRSRFAFLLVALLGPAAWPGCSSSTPDPDASRSTAAKFLDEIRAGKVSNAWEGTTTEFKSLLGREGLEGYVRAHPALKEKEPADFVSFNTAERNGLPLGECAFRSASRKSSIKVLLAREDGAWKVERLTVD
jgi:hypothetical protein